MKVPLASPNLRPQERSYKAPGFAHQPQKEQQPQRGLFRGEAVEARVSVPDAPCSLSSICFSPPSRLCPPALRHCSPGYYCNPVPSNSTQAMGVLKT